MTLLYGYWVRGRLFANARNEQRLKLKNANNLKSMLRVTRKSYMKKTNYPNKRCPPKRVKVQLTCSFVGIILTENCKNSNQSKKVLVEGYDQKD